MSTFPATGIPATRAAGQVVSRPRLVELLDDAVTRPVTLLEAPAGHGKTTAVVDWMGETARRTDYSWIDVRRTAGDPVRFVRDLARGVDAVFGGEGPRRLDVAEGTVSAVLDDLMDGMEDHEAELVTVLDDLDRGGPAILAVVDQLIAAIPDRWRLVITARTRPAVAVPRLRSWLAISEIGPEELRFDVAEATELLRGRFCLDVTDDVIGDLTARLDGWAAGLSLAGLSAMRSGDPGRALAAVTGHHPYIDDYLTTELLPALPDGLRQFLVETAPLEWLAIGLCNAVTGRDDSQAYIEALLSWPTVTVEYTDSDTWVRHDEVFRDWLMTVAKRTMPDRIPAVLDGAARWCSDHDMAEDAIAYAMRAGRHDVVAALLGRHGHRLVTDHRHAPVTEAMDVLPSDVADATPELYVLGVHAAFRARDWPLLARLGNRAQQLSHDVDGARAAALERALAMVQTLQLLHEGHVQRALACIPALARPVPPHTPGLVMHAGWSASGAALLAHLTAYLNGLLTSPATPPPPELAELRSMGEGATPTIVRALVACHAADEEGARALAIQAVAERQRGDPELELLLSALVFAWAGTGPEAAEAAELADDLSESMNWWFADVVRDLTAIELARRQDRWRSLNRTLDRVRAAMAELPDAGALHDVLLGHQLARIDGASMRPPQLTDRELEVLRHLVVSSSRRAIADALFVSVNTVKTHLRAVYRKLGTDTREGAVARGRELGLLEP